ncbi:MAG TPA: cytochrome c biogenesis protein CcdA [Burkholderiales bacterium]|nr:cytochrome c biogenesis protein CcdA [Burkholderiales bacterium]
MLETGLIAGVALPVGLGLLGFVEPCSIGTTLLFVKTLEGREASGKLAQIGVFMSIRALLMGALGLSAVAVGGAFLGFQKAAWLAFGSAYALIGVAYLAGKSAWLARALGPRLTRLSSVNGAAALGTLFAFNIPACAGPLILALLGMAAASGASGASLGHGFFSLALFGLALSLPILLVALSRRARGALDRLAALSRRMPLWTGLILIVLGLWSIWFGLFVSIANPA